MTIKFNFKGENLNMNKIIKPGRGRPIKETIEYFSHYAVKPREVSILQKEFGYDKGYRVYYELMELLGRSPNQIIEHKNKFNKLYIAGELNLDMEELDGCLSFMSRLGILCPECFNQGYVFSEELMKCLIKLYNKRKNDLPKHFCGKTIERADIEKEEASQILESVA